MEPPTLCEPICLFFGGCCCCWCCCFATGNCSVLFREHALVCQTTCTTKAHSCHNSDRTRTGVYQKQVDKSACPASSPLGVDVKEHHLPD